MSEEEKGRGDEKPVQLVRSFARWTFDISDLTTSGDDFDDRSIDHQSRYLCPEFYSETGKKEEESLEQKCLQEGEERARLIPEKEGRKERKRDQLSPIYLPSLIW